MLFIVANDPEGRPLTYAPAGSMPAGAYLDPQQGVLFWRPAANHEGVFRINFTVSDYSSSVSGTVEIIVEAVDNALPHPARHARGDFDGDGKAELVLFRQGTQSQWLSRPADEQRASAIHHGGLTGNPVLGDFNGDNITDRAVLEDSFWRLRLSGMDQEARLALRSGGGTPAPADYDGDGRDDLGRFFVPSMPAYGRFAYFEYLSSATGELLIEHFGLFGDVPVPCNYFGDAKAEFAVYRPQFGDWYFRLENGETTQLQFGLEHDLPVPADFDGDGYCEPAVYRPSTGQWFVRGRDPVQFGLGGDLPVPADYDGNGAAELGIFRPSSGIWFIKYSAENIRAVQFGLPTDQIPYAELLLAAFRQRFGVTELGRVINDKVSFFSAASQSLLTLPLGGHVFFAARPGDYVVKGSYKGLRTDASPYALTYGIFSGGSWSFPLIEIRHPPRPFEFGLPGDVPVSGDFDGDGFTDLAVYRRGDWYFAGSEDQRIHSFSFGLAGDLPLAADFNADGLEDAVVYRALSGTWFVRDTRSGWPLQMVQFGDRRDIVRIADFDGDLRPDKVLYRPSLGLWVVLLSSGGALVRQWGQPGDIPVPYAMLRPAAFGVFRRSSRTLYIRTVDGEVSSVRLPSGMRPVGLQPVTTVTR